MLRLMRWGDDEKQQHQRVLEPEREELDDYPSGPHKLTVLSKYRVHVARMAVDEMWRDNLKCVNNGKKIEAIHDDADRTMMAARWFKDGLKASDLSWLQDTCYSQIDQGMCSAFVEIWNEETSSFHLPFGEMTMTLDDVSNLLHLPIDGLLLFHKSMPKAEAVQMMMKLLVDDGGDTWKEVDDTEGGHARFSYLKIIFKERLREARTAYHDGQFDEMQQTRDQSLQVYWLFFWVSHSSLTRAQPMWISLI